MSPNQTDLSDEWVSFEAAGRLIDGPSGWDYDHANRKRPRAEALLKFAYEGLLQTSAQKWTFSKSDEIDLVASADNRTGFLYMLFCRVKGRKDKFEIIFSDTSKTTVEFEISDDVNGHYEATTFEQGHMRAKLNRHVHRVAGLRFSVSDIRSHFQLAGVAPARVEVQRVAKGGRPAVADWESAALEMARRFYLGDLKAERLADVLKQLTDWLAEQDVHPSPTTLRDHAKRYLEAFGKWEAE
jgi:hypothetical protein